jgi:hypothetical protein
MISKILARLSYANVIATLALFLALGGTAYAAGTIGSGAIIDNSIRSEDIRNGAVKSIDVSNGTIASGDILDGTVASGDILDDTIVSGDISDDTVASGDILDDTIVSGDISNGTIAAADMASGVLAPRLFGNFNGDDGSLVRGQGIQSSSRFSTGLYFVTFTQNVTNCVLFSSVTSIDAVNPESVTSGIGYSGGATAFVMIRKDFVDTREDADFSVSALC